MFNKLLELKKYFEKYPDRWLGKNELLMITRLSSSVANQGQLRGYISELRKQGMFIISKKGKGYKLSNNLNEVIKYTQNEIDKHKAMLVVYYSWKKVLDHKQLNRLYEQTLLTKN